ncbi:MAG: hypothetical protein BWY85_01919 [Firmicutes bacterium ADurb.Bin506]|nr:MAG: hypothetical protein BWY85_01919 [Firmicutes bacterium ADurb.Bin506]
MMTRSAPPAARFRATTLTLAIAICLIAGRVSAQGPSATETPWPRATPTPWAIVDIHVADALDTGEGRAAEMADTLINAYQFLNQNGAIDFVLFVTLSAAILGLMTRLIRSAKND